MDIGLMIIPLYLMTLASLYLVYVHLVQKVDKGSLSQEVAMKFEIGLIFSAIFITLSFIFII